MSCTIDHLRIDLIATVRQEFTDARGGRHRSGEPGVIRHLGVDWSRQAIVIEWDRGGERERMYFLLAGKEGPGNGRMRTYFDVKEPPPPPPLPRPPRRALSARLRLIPVRPAVESIPSPRSHSSSHESQLPPD